MYTPTRREYWEYNICMYACMYACIMYVCMYVCTLFGSPIANWRRAVWYRCMYACMYICIMYASKLNIALPSIENVCIYRRADSARILYMYVCMHVCMYYVDVFAPIVLGSTIYVCMHACIYVLCMYPIGALFSAPIYACMYACIMYVCVYVRHVCIDVSQVEYYYIRQRSWAVMY